MVTVMVPAIDMLIFLRLAQVQLFNFTFNI